jgi:uncharacterized protein YhfF
LAWDFTGCVDSGIGGEVSVILHNQAYLAYWKEFLVSRGLDVEHGGGYQIDEFGDNPDLANELVDLILKGEKTASCATLYEYQRDYVGLTPSS